MVTTTDFATFQQQLRQEMPDVTQQLSVEVNDSISGRMDMLNSLNTALLNVSAKPTDSKPYRKRRIPKLHVRLALVDTSVAKPRRKMLVSVESTEILDSSTIAFDCSDEELRSIEASLHQVLHRTTANEPLGIVQHGKGQNAFEAWRVCYREKVRSEEHVGSKISMRSDVHQRDEQILSTRSTRTEMRKRCSQSRN